jgi:protein PhnA
MSTGFKGKFHRQNILSRYAKDLVRRSRSSCELCENNGVRLEVHELPPFEDEPVFDHCIFICEECLKQIEHPKKIVPLHWRCLNNALYSSVPAVQVMSYRMLRRLVAANEHWAEELLEHAYLDPELESWAEQAE